jgi:competence ComEA-like helix-hairpin-helix protein
LLLLLAAAGAGLGVAHWRAAHPELVERLERLDRDIARSGDAEVEVEEPRAAPRAEARAPRARAEARAPRPPAGGESEPRPVRARPAKRAVSPSGEPDPPLDLNGATLSDLLRLPGVGPVNARRILEARQDAGRFAAVDDLATVRGLGRAKLERLRPFVGVLE